ncbi:DUF3011 domain-containing protein [Tolypothrix sp. FACHB-123]|uniref:DUF3011 domain-containing protein n=1 Tax=Tolypothrix sp. FACHB-123 TaxID=2692868 RepID=UPI001683DD6E|nr:DUF3011 domain-containing protein [Tolypothrix sp. FACHB-123]MBD2356356.1 DUF3011 domain-containing protein [Tolypothrix sp. FACHB-123]
MVTRFPLIAASFIAASITIGTILGVPTPASAQQVITCESYNNRGNSCAIPTRGRVRLIRQLSNASCRDNWGFNRNRIWVRNGCRAQFVMGDRGFNRFNRYERYNRRNDRRDRYDRYDRYDRRDRYDRYDRYDR